MAIDNTSHHNGNLDMFGDTCVEWQTHRIAITQAGLIMNLTIPQALSLAEWLEQERPMIEKLMGSDEQ